MKKIRAKDIAAIMVLLIAAGLLVLGIYTIMQLDSPLIPVSPVTARVYYLITPYCESVFLGFKACGQWVGFRFDNGSNGFLFYQTSGCVPPLQLDQNLTVYLYKGQYGTDQDICG